MSLGLSLLHTCNTIAANGLQMSIKKTHNYILFALYMAKKKIKTAFLEDEGKMQEELFKRSENNSGIMLRPFTAGQVFIIEI